MSAVHLATRRGILCSTVSSLSSGSFGLGSTADRASVSCRRCLKGIEAANESESAAAADRRYLARMEADCRAIGIGHLWDAIEVDTADGRMVRGLLGSLAGYFAESIPQERAA